jgi:hypothetical protein
MDITEDNLAELDTIYKTRHLRTCHPALDKLGRPAER